MADGRSVKFPQPPADSPPASVPLHLIYEENIELEPPFLVLCSPAYAVKTQPICFAIAAPSNLIDQVVREHCSD